MRNRSLLTLLLGSGKQCLLCAWLQVHIHTSVFVTVLCILDLYRGDPHFFFRMMHVKCSAIPFATDVFPTFMSSWYEICMLHKICFIKGYLGMRPGLMELLGPVEVKKKMLLRNLITISESALHREKCFDHYSLPHSILIVQKNFM